MDEDLKQAIKLVKQNGYMVVKWTDTMEKAANEYEEIAENGGFKDCCGCPCSICLINR